MDVKQASSRDRVMTALEHAEGDRIPIDYWANDEVTDRLMAHHDLPNREALLRRLGVDLRYVMGPSFAGQQFRTHSDGLVEDHWGVLRRAMTVDGTDRVGRSWSWSYRHVERAPLEQAETVQEIERYEHWPSAEMWDYSQVETECRRAAETGCAVVNGGDRLDRTAQLKPATYIRGLEQFLSDLLLQPAMAECLLERIVHYYLEYNERVFAAASGTIDIFFMGDDMGTQTSLWVSPKLYRKFFKDNFRRFNDLAHKYGMKTMYHTCGNVTKLIPDFIDCGLDVLQSLQPAAMDLAALKREYGKDLAFQGGIDIQQTMPNGSPADVAEEVKLRAASLGPGGGYIFGTAHNLLPDVPTENIVALFDAYLEHGRYPI
jgi:uroporphyrinogen decarboxylase